MQFKVQAAIIIFIICLSITACDSGEPGNQNVVFPTFEVSPPNSSASLDGLCNNNLNPVIQNATWMYTSIGGPGGSFNYTNSITEVRADGFTLTTQFTDHASSEQWTCQTDGLKALQLGSGSTAGISIQAMSASLITSNVTGLSLPKDIAPNMQWQYSLTLDGTIVMPGDPQAPAHGTYSVIMQEIGSETVTVPAGTFDAIKIQSNSTVDIVSAFGGIEVPIKFNGTTITWYVPGIGYVKSVENGDFSGTVFSTTTELQSYSIP